MRWQSIVAVAVVGLTVSGCDLGLSKSKYEIVRAGNQTFLLEKDTGRAQVIEGASLIDVKPLEIVPQDNSASRAKTWPVQSIPQLDNISLVTKTKYRDGMLLYSVEATPFKGRLEKEFNSSKTGYLRRATIYLDLYDSDGFSIGEPVELQIGGATRIVNDKGEPHALSWAGSQAISLDAYRSGAYQNVRWAGFAE